MLMPLTGSHTVLVLLEHDYTVVVMDNLDNSFQKAYDRMVELAGDKAKNMRFIKVSSGLSGMRSCSRVAVLIAHVLLMKF
jgi:nucleoside-diphosphate-sugar epimerase